MIYPYPIVILNEVKDLLTPFVIQSEAKNLGNIYKNVYEDVLEILPPFGRLNDISIII